MSAQVGSKLQEPIMALSLYWHRWNQAGCLSKDPAGSTVSPTKYDMKQRACCCLFSKRSKVTDH